MDKKGIHLWLILWRAFRAVSAYAEQDITRSLGMCLSDFGILEILLHKGPLPVNEIGQIVQLTSGSITTAVDRLEQRGLVDRQSSPDDRRARIVHLTPQGEELIGKAFARHEAAMERVADKLPEAEREVLAGLMKKFGYRAAELLQENRAAERKDSI
jgi:MarR family 2-MHQ and catechol resistance regulon transcriptional repressor